MTLESDLRSSIEAAANETDRDCLLAELAAYLARMGQFDEASTIIASLRTAQPWTSARLTASIMLAEGLVRLRNEYDHEARDRLLRGYTLALAFREQEVAGHIAAWLLQLSFNRLSPDDLAKWGQTCAGLRTFMSRSARTRFCLTQASISSLAGDVAGADVWFRAARALAVKLGDEATLSASMYNRSALGIARARVNWALDANANDDLVALGMEIGSAISYSNATANNSAPQLQSLWLGRVELLRSRFGAAVERIGTALLSLPEASELHIRLGIESDLAFGHGMSGNLEIANAMYDALPADADELLLVDDLVVYYRQRQELGALLQRADVASEASQRLERAVAALDGLRGRLKAASVPFDPVWTQ